MKLSAFTISQIATKVIFEGVEYTAHEFEESELGSKYFQTNLSKAGLDRLCGESEDNLPGPGQFSIQLGTKTGTVIC